MNVFALAASTLIKAVNGPKFDRNAFHELGNIRNAFAHGYLVAGIRKRGSGVFGKLDDYVVVESLKPDGSLKGSTKHRSGC